MLCLGSPLNSMIREGCVAAVLRSAFRHVTSKAITVFWRMRSRKAVGVAGETARPVIRSGLRRPIVRIVTRTAPEPPFAVAHASTQGELLDVADYLEITSRRPRRRGIVIDGICFFQPLSRDKVAEFFAGIGDSRGSKQMALLANAVARPAL